MRGSSVLISLSLVCLSQGFGFGSRYSHSQGFSSLTLQPAGWSEAWKPVADGLLGQYPGGKWLVDGAPPQKLEVLWPDMQFITNFTRI